MKIPPISPLQRATYLLLVSLSWALLAFGPARLTESDEGRMPIYPSQIRLMTQNPAPKLNAKAGLIMDQPTGRVVWDLNGHQRLAPASTTKIMTAILALEKGKLTDKVTVKAENLVGESSMGLAPRDVVTLEDLLWGLLLPSGNDAANVIAVHISGSTAGFVQMMNDKVKELGLEDTQFKNPHGLDEEGHFSSAYDLAIMGRYGMKNPTFAKMVGTNMYTVNASRTFYLLNTNQLLRRLETVPGVNGIKTGNTGDAGDCIVASVNRNGHSTIDVVLGAESRVPEITKVIEYAYHSFLWTPLRLPAVTTVVGEDGQIRQLSLPVTREEMLPLWQKDYLASNVVIDRPLIADDPTGQVGTARFRIADSLLVSLPVFAKPVAR